MNPTTIQVLRLLHIVLGAWWLGSMIFMALFLMPSLRAAGPGASSMMEHMAIKLKLPIYVMVVSLVTVFSGFGLYWNASSGFSGPWMHSGPGMTFGTGAAFALFTVIIGMGVSSPTGKRLGALGAEVRARGGPPSPEQVAEMQRLQDKLAGAGRLSTGLLVIAAACMALARYMPS